MVTYQASHGAIAMPIPLHAQTPGALAAVEAHRRIGLERILHREVHGFTDGRGDLRGGLVTKHGNPARSRWVGEVVTRNARSMLATATGHGFTAHMLTTDEQCVVEGYRLAPLKVGFRATWLRGAAGGFAWCTPWAYELQDDDRPVGIDSVARVGKVGYRSPGVDRQHLRIVGSPWGLPVAYNELVRRIRAADEVSS